MAGLERLGEGLERVWKGFGNGDGGAWTARHEVLDKALALSRSEKIIQDASRVTWRGCASGRRAPHGILDACGAH